MKRSRRKWCAHRLAQRIAICKRSILHHLREVNSGNILKVGARFRVVLSHDDLDFYRDAILWEATNDAGDRPAPSCHPTATTPECEWIPST